MEKLLIYWLKRLEEILEDTMPQEGSESDYETLRPAQEKQLAEIQALISWRESQNPDASEGALPRSRVVKSKFIWVRYRTWNGAMVTDVEKAESESEAVEKLKNRGMEEIEARQIYF